MGEFFYKGEGRKKTCPEPFTWKGCNYVKVMRLLLLRRASEWLIFFCEWNAEMDVDKFRGMLRSLSIFHSIEFVKKRWFGVEVISSIISITYEQSLNDFHFTFLRFSSGFCGSKMTFEWLFNVLVARSKRPFRSNDLPARNMRPSSEFIPNDRTFYVLHNLENAFKFCNPDAFESLYKNGL